MLISIIKMLLGFVLLLLGADWLVKGASSLAKRMHLPETVIGLTIVALGTSTPEMVINIASSIKGLSQLTLANVIGSNNFDLFIVLGVSALIFPLDGHKGTTWKELPLALISSLLLLILVHDSWFRPGSPNQLGRIDGFVLLLMFVLFIIYTEHLNRTAQASVPACKLYPLPLTLTMMVGGLGCLAFGVSHVVDQAVQLAHRFNISEKVIGLTIVSAGTSLPELVTSGVAALRHEPEIAIGNIVGSSLYNLLLILGVSALIKPIPYLPTFNVDLTFMITAFALLFFFMFIGNKHALDRWQGAKLLAVYAVYLILMFKFE